MSINMLIEYDMVMVCILKDFEIPLIMENPLMWVHQQLKNTTICLESFRIS